MKKLPDVQIAQVTRADLPAIQSLAREVTRRQVFPTLSSHGQRALAMAQDREAAEIIFNPHYQARKAVSGDALVGYIAWRDDNHLAQLFVDEAYQGQGIGTKLLKEVFDCIGEATLTVRASLNATAFYHKQGFEQTGEQAEVNHIRFVPMQHVGHD